MMHGCGFIPRRYEQRLCDWVCERGTPQEHVCGRPFFPKDPKQTVCGDHSDAKRLEAMRTRKRRLSSLLEV